VENRSDGEYENKIRKLFSAVKFLYYQDSQETKKQLLIQLKNGYYWKVYGSREIFYGSRRGQRSYLYIYSHNLRVTIPRASKIYKKNLELLDTFGDEIKSLIVFGDFIEYNLKNPATSELAAEQCGGSPEAGIHQPCK